MFLRGVVRVHVAGEIAQNYFVDSYFPKCLLDKAELM
jgi:hypothetical protein